MIFVTVGSQKFQFDRLLKAVDELVANGSINEEVFAQSGSCQYVPKAFPSKSYIGRDEFRKKMERCDLVITHGGTGAIVGAIKAGKKVIAVPRLAKYGEHVDDHQIQLIKQFTESNLICTCEDLNTLGELIEEVRQKDFGEFKSNTVKYLETLSSYIDHIK